VYNVEFQKGNMRPTLFGILIALAQLPLAAATRESLKSLAVPHTTITLAETVPAGQFTLPAGSPPPFPGGGAEF
jgi:hypothetical protein